MDPPTIRPLLTLLITILAIVVSADVLRLNVPSFAEFWESYLGFLMRESERNKVNGVIWYLVGVITVLGLYPRDVAVVSILTFVWSSLFESEIDREIGFLGRIQPLRLLVDYGESILPLYHLTYPESKAFLLRHANPLPAFSRRLSLGS